MKIHFLGTSNAAGIPMLFCTCSICNNARNEGGKNLRTRSSVLINDDLLVDISPDIGQQTLRNKMNLESIENILITHTHEDHFSLFEASNKRLVTGSNIKTLNLFMSRTSKKNVKLKHTNKYFRNFRGEKIETYKFHWLDFHNKYYIDRYEIYPIGSNHLIEGDEEGNNYIILDGEKTILYASDAGFYNDETFEFLYSFKFDFIIMECNNGLEEYNNNHLGINQVIEAMYRLYNHQSISMVTRCYLTHITHNTDHELFSETLKEYPFSLEVAYDDLVLLI